MKSPSVPTSDKKQSFVSETSKIGNTPEVASFVSDTAAKLGESESKIKQEIQISKEELKPTLAEPLEQKFKQIIEPKKPEKND